MKVVVCLSFFFAFSSFIEVNGNIMETLIDQTIEECKKIENATDEDADALFNVFSLSETREGKCFFGCFLESIGIVRKFLNKTFFL